MAIFNGNSVITSYKSSNYFYVAGRYSNESGYTFQRSVDGKVWEDVDTESFELSLPTNMLEINGMLILVGTDEFDRCKMLLTTDDFVSVVSYIMPYNLLQLEWAGGDNVIGSARLSNDSFVSPVFITLNGLGAAPTIQLKTPAIKVSDWSNTNHLYANSDNSITFYDGATVYHSPDGIVWDAVTSISDTQWMQKHGEFFYYRQDIFDSVNFTRTISIYKTADFKTTERIYNKLNGNPTLVSPGVQQFDELVLWEIGTNTAYFIELDGTMRTVTTSGIPTNVYPGGYMHNPTTGRRIMFGYLAQYYSDDGGITWNTASFSLTFKYSYFYKGVFIGAFQNGPYDLELYQSADGINWTKIVTPENFTGSAYIGFGFQEYNGELIFYKTSGFYNPNVMWKTSNGIDWTLAGDYPNPTLTYASVRLLATDKLNAFIKLDSSTILKTKTLLTDTSWSGMPDSMLENPINASFMGSDREGTVYFGPQYGINKNSPITKTTDAGATFTTFPYPMERSGTSARMVTRIDGILYATGTEYDEEGNTLIGLYRSTDWNNWTRIVVDIGGNLGQSRFSNMYLSYDNKKWVIACNMSQFYAADQILAASYNQTDWTLKVLNSTDTDALVWKELPTNVKYSSLRTDNIEATTDIALGRNSLGASPFASTMSSNSTGLEWSPNDIQNPEYNPNEFSMPIRGSGSLFVTIGEKDGGDTVFIFSTTGKDWFEPASPLRIDLNYSHDISPIYATDNRLYLFESTQDDQSSNIKMYTYDYSGQLLAESLVDEKEGQNDSLRLNPIVLTNGTIWSFSDLNRLVYSTDFVNWNVVTMPDNSNFIDYEFKPHGYVAASPTKTIIRSNSRMLISTDNLATWNEFNGITPAPGIEIYLRSITYSKTKNKFFILYASYDPSTNRDTDLLIESSDAVSWSEVTLPNYERPGIPYYSLTLVSTDNYDMFIAGDNNNDAIGVWLMSDTGWVESDLGDSVEGYYVAGNYNNVPPFRGLYGNTDEQSTLIICSGSGSGPET